MDINKIESFLMSKVVFDKIGRFLVYSNQKICSFFKFIEPILIGSFVGLLIIALFLTVAKTARNNCRDRFIKEAIVLKIGQYDSVTGKFVIQKKYQKLFDSVKGK